MGSSFDKFNDGFVPEADLEQNKFKIGTRVKYVLDGVAGEVIDIFDGRKFRIKWEDNSEANYTKNELEANLRGNSFVIIPPKTKDQLLAQIAELQKQVEEIEKKEEEKYVKIKDHSFINMYSTPRSCGQFKNKGYYLSSSYNWEIIKDSTETLVLVPTKKL